MKRPLFFSFFMIAFPALVCSEGPVVFPGSIAERPGSNRYLTADNYGQVREYYMGIYGSPHHEGKQNATFFYEETIFEPRGVHLNHLRADSKGADRVFAQLKRLVLMSETEGKEILSEARYKEIEHQYRPLKDYYYAYEEDESGRYVPMDEAIFRKYHKTLGLGGMEAFDKEEIMAEAQELIMSGKVEEGTALLEQMRNQVVEDIEYASSPEAVDLWIKCLEEINACKFGVMVRIDR